MTAVVKLLGDLEHMRTLPAKQADDDVYGVRLRNEFGRVVANVGHKQSAAELNTPESTLSHMIAGRGHRYLRLEWAIWALRRDPTLGFAKALVAAAGLLVTKAPELTEGELLMGVLAAAAKMLQPALMEPLMQDGYREALEAKARKAGG